MFISTYLTYFEVVSLDLFLSIPIYIYLSIYISIYIHMSIYIYEAGNHQGKYDHLSMDEKSEASFAS